MKAALAVALLVVVAAFYWFILRPEQIRASCTKEVSQYGVWGSWTAEEINIGYLQCVHEHGLAS